MIAIKHLPLRECGYAIGFVVLLVALYVGGYYAMVERIVTLTSVTPGGVRVSRLEKTVTVGYRFESELLHRIFAPMHALDRRLRPEWWNPA